MLDGAVVEHFPPSLFCRTVLPPPGSQGLCSSALMVLCGAGVPRPTCLVSSSSSCSHPASPSSGPQTFHPLPPHPFCEAWGPKGPPCPIPTGAFKMGPPASFQRQCQAVIMKPTSVTYWVTLGKSLHLSNPVSRSTKSSCLYLPLRGRAAVGRQRDGLEGA